MDCTYRTNRYGMPLLNIVGITCTYSTFNAAFCFVKEETKDLYEWALNELQKIVKSPVRVTDRELALINAIKAIFHGTKILLCTWHINKNILANTKSMFKDDQDWENFMNDWNVCISIGSKIVFDTEWLNFKRKWEASYIFAIKYVENIGYLIKKCLWMLGATIACI